MDQTSGLRILIVEDEALVSMMLVDFVAELHHEVTDAVTTVPDALDKLAVDRPDLVLLDINLAGQMSYPVADHCRIEGIPVVLTTGYQVADLPPGLSRCPVLQKPFSTDALMEAINAAVGPKS